MTVLKQSHQSEFGIDYIQYDNVCNAYLGDTDCNTKLPVLCKKKLISRRARPMQWHALTMQCQKNSIAAGLWVTLEQR
jgi:hypothetical protein